MATRSFAALTTGFPRARVASALVAALAVATAGAGLVAIAPALAIARQADGASTAPAFTAGPLLAVLALAPAGLAWWLALSGRSAAAAGVLAGFGALAPGRAVLDLQLVVAPWRAARPELLVPSSLAPLHPGPGAWLLVLGHVITAASAVLAAASIRHAVAETPAERGPGTGGPGAFVVALCVGVLAAFGLVLAPFASSDAFLLPMAAPDAPVPAMIGMLLVAGGVVLAACLAASAADPDAGRGGLWGAALGVLAVALPPLAAAAFSPAVGATWGPLIALVAGAALAAIAFPLGSREDTPVDDAELRLPAVERLHGVAGALAVTSGLLALLGAATRQVRVPDGVQQPVLYAARLLVPSGLLLLVLGGALIVGAVSPRWARPAALVRPVLAVSWATVALAGTAVLDAALTAVQIPGVHADVGVWAAGFALLAAMAAGCAAALAGGVERDEVDLGELQPSAVAVAVGAATVPPALGAFGLPLLTAPDYAPPGLWSNFQVASWGLVVGLAAVVAAALLAPFSRPSRAVGLTIGALAVLGLHLAEVPVTGGRAGSQASVAAGTWFGLVCALALLAGAAFALWRSGRPAAAEKYAPDRPQQEPQQEPQRKAQRKPQQNKRRPHGGKPGRRA
jgi:hypothetical protein